MSIRNFKSGTGGVRIQIKMPYEARPRVVEFPYLVPLAAADGSGWRAASRKEKLVISGRAVALRELWVQERLDSLSDPTRVFNPWDTTTNTGIKGIAYSRLIDSEGYHAEAFRCNVYHHGRQHTAVVRLGRRTWEDAWARAVDRIADIKELSKATRRSMHTCTPCESRLRVAP